MLEVSKVPNTVLLIKDQRACLRCRRCEHCTLIPIKDQKAMHVGGVESAYRALNTE